MYVHAQVRKCHSGIFSERAGMVIPCQCSPQKRIIAFEKSFLFRVPMNIQKDWEAKLESAYSFMLKYSKITVWLADLLDLLGFKSNGNILIGNDIEFWWIIVYNGPFSTIQLLLYIRTSFLSSYTTPQSLNTEVFHVN